MIKSTLILVLSLSACLLSCKKKNSYGYKIAGMWTCDSIREYLPDNNGNMIYDTTDIIPKPYVFKKSKGKSMYKWNGMLVRVIETEGSLYKEGPLGDVGDTWFITYIDEHKCVLRLDYTGGLGSYITNQYWYYLRR